MVFQKPTPFPTMSIFDNVAAGLRVERPASQGASWHETVEQALAAGAALWDEVKDRLHQPAPWRSPAGSSSGSASRAPSRRAPEVVLLDEPTASLDPQGTQRIEELLYQLKRDFTIVIVTHNMQQAARVSDTTSFFYMGDAGRDRRHAPDLHRAGATKQTEAYITGRFG